MKNIFGINCTGNPEVTEVDGNVFRTKNVSAEHARYLQESANEIDKLEKKLTLPTALKIVMWTCGILVLVIIAAVIMALNKQTDIIETFINAPAFFLAFFALLLVWLVLSVISRNKRRKYAESNGKKMISEKFDEVRNESRILLGVPDDAKEIDVMSYCYEIKNNREITTHKKLYDYVLLPFFAFSENGKLCLCSMDERYEIPMTNIKSIEKAGVRVSADSWNKEIPPKEYPGNEKNFKVVQSNGKLLFAPYYSIRIDFNREKYELLIPGWEYDTFSFLTGVNLAVQSYEGYIDE